MKFILVILAFVVLLWLLRGTFGRGRPPSPSRAPGMDRPQPMLACAQCGIHLPLDEALPGRGGVFCSDAHRAVFEKAHPET